MSTDKTLTIYDLYQRVEQEVREAMAEGPINEFELPSEVADSNVPVYNHDLFTVLLSNSGLWYAQSETGCGAEDDVTPVSITQAVIYDALREHAEEIMNEVLREWEEAAEDAAAALGEARQDAIPDQGD